MARHSNAHIRQAVRVLVMLGELHKRGFQLLGAMPYMSPSGLYWRCSIGPAMLFFRNHGAILDMTRDPTEDDKTQATAAVAHYSSGQGNHYFDWCDAENDNPRSLAGKFINRFSLLSKRGQGWDYPYAGWFQRLLGLAEANWFPVVLSDDNKVSYDRVPLMNVSPAKRRERRDAEEPILPPPPPGMLQDDYRL